MKILLVEDDVLIAESLAKALADQHYSVEVVADGQAGWEMLQSFDYDLILLDVMLPKLDGISLCRQVRSQGKQTPIVLLTAQDTSTKKVVGLDAGADDYVAKPFDLQELLARIRALLRRGNSSLPPLLEWENLRLDPSLCEVTCNEQLLHLTPKEYGLLELFLRNSHRIFSTSALIDHLWSFEEPPTEDTVRSHIKRLRQKLKTAGLSNNPIETVYGIGYRLRPPETSAIPSKVGEKQADQNNHKKLKELKEELEQEPLEEPLTQNSLQKSDNHTPTSVESQTLTGIANIWQKVRESLSHRVTIIEQATTLLLQERLNDELREQAEQEAHKLAGSLGMFGTDLGSQIAQRIEPLFSKECPLDTEQILHLSQLVTALRQELRNMDASYLLNSPVAAEAVDNRPLLLVVGSNGQLAEEWQAESGNWGLRSRIVPNPVMAREQITEKRPDVVLLDLASADTLENYLTLLAELSACTPPVPAVVLIAQESLIDRVRVARLGGRRVLQQPVTAPQVLESVHQVLQHTRPTQAMVMVVDDDPQVLMALQQLLIPWGLHVNVLDNPLLFLDTLENEPPDLLVLDVEMPHINGVELCQVVRNDPRWSSLPILFLTAHADTRTVHQVFAAGADDYVNKPIVGPELVTRILNRLERSRLLKAFSETDALTGVANRRKSTQAMTEFLEWSKHCQQPLCLAVLELNNLEQITQQHGHAVGDEVLARFGELLRQTFHSEDVVGRWGGGEFVVGMVGMTKQDGDRRLLELRKTLNQFEFKATDGSSFRAKFSAGVAQFPQDGDNLQALYQIANAALS